MPWMGNRDLVMAFLGNRDHWGAGVRYDSNVFNSGLYERSVSHFEEKFP